MTGYSYGKTLSLSCGRFFIVSFLFGYTKNLPIAVSSTYDMLAPLGAIASLDHRSGYPTNWLLQYPECFLFKNVAFFGYGKIPTRCSVFLDLNKKNRHLSLVCEARFFQQQHCEIKCPNSVPELAHCQISILCVITN